MSVSHTRPNERPVLLLAAIPLRDSASTGHIAVFKRATVASKLEVAPLVLAVSRFDGEIADHVRKWSGNQAGRHASSSF